MYYRVFSFRVLIQIDVSLLLPHWSQSRHSQQSFLKAVWGANRNMEMIQHRFLSTMTWQLFFIVLAMFSINPVKSFPRILPKRTLRQQSSFLPYHIPSQYKLLAQMGSNPETKCPLLWKYSGVPENQNLVYMLAHRDIYISGDGRPCLEPCADSPNSFLIVVSSKNFTSCLLDSFQSSLSDVMEKYTTFNSLQEQSKLANIEYFVSAPYTENKFTCEGRQWFNSSDLFMFFRGQKMIMLPIVKDIQDRVPTIYTVPLEPHIRYMTTIREGASCIYASESDMEMLNVTAPVLEIQSGSTLDVSLEDDI